MNNLLSLSFWLNIRPDSLPLRIQQIFTILVVVVIILTVATGLIKVRNKKNLYSRFWQGLYAFFLTNAIVGIFLLFFTYEHIPFLSARFWFILWGVEIVVWLFFITKTLLVVPGRKKEIEKEKEFKKYIP